MRRIFVLFIGVFMLLAAGYACAESNPDGGMIPREVPEEAAEIVVPASEGFLGKLRARLLAVMTELTGPEECETGQEYSWTLSDGTGSAATNWYQLSVAVLDGTYENPNTSDIQYLPARSGSRDISYTFYFPGTYVIFADTFASESSSEALFTRFLRVTVTDGGENAVTEIIHSVAGEKTVPGDEFSTVLALHDWILDNCVYDNSKVYYSAESLFLNGTGVCNSYTRAFALLLEEAGIECSRVSGYVNGNPKSGHAWNAVKINGEWYLIDCTWDDSQTGDFGRHSYFAVTSQLLEINHTPRHYAGFPFWPECSSLDDNWFVHEDNWREYAPALLSDYSEKTEIGWHRFSLTAPVVISGKYPQTMLGTVIAYAMSKTTWSYGEGKECTGTFSYDYNTGLITGKHEMGGILKLPWSLTHVEEDAFANNGANMVVIWDNCESIGSGAFAGMDLWELAVGSDDMEIAEGAFEGIDFVYVIANPESTIAKFAWEHGWAVGDGNGTNTYEPD